MKTNIMRGAAVVYAGFWTVFAAFSGAAEGGVWANLPNAAPWVLVWAAIALAWREPKAGGWFFLILALASVFFFNTYQHLITFALVSAPLALFGWFFVTRG